jgi:hypothetical protein
VPADEFSKHYASLSDEGLGEIDRDDLIEAARVCYDQELSRRGLKIESAAPVVEAPPEDIEWVPLDAFDAEEFKVIRALLDDEGIPTRTDPPTAGNYPPVAAGTILFVPEKLLERARQALMVQISDEELIAEAEAQQPPEDA